MQLVLTHEQIQQKIRRFSHEILELTYGTEELFVGGIQGNGEVIANEIVSIIKENSSKKVTIFSLHLDKDEPLSFPISCTIDTKELKDKTVILVDDVINSGTTMQYALVKILEEKVRTVKTVALVDRLHRRYPIKCDIVGMTLTTTLQERVEVLPSNGNLEAFLV